MQDTLSDPPSTDPLVMGRPAPRYRIQAMPVPKKRLQVVSFRHTVPLVSATGCSLS